MKPQSMLRTDAARVLEQDLGWQVRLLARQMTLAYDAALADSGLSGTQFALMCQIASSPDDTLGALAQQAGLNQSTMSRNVDVLVKAGLAELVATEQDRRKRAVWLTEQGVRRLQQAIPLWQVAQQQLQQQLGAAWPGALQAGLARLASLAPEEPARPDALPIDVAHPGGNTVPNFSGT